MNCVIKGFTLFIAFIAFPFVICVKFVLNKLTGETKLHVLVK